jgi:hypothetical protein
MQIIKYFMWLFLLVLPGAVLTATTPTPDDLCKLAARRAGVNMTSYPVNVAHSLHSLTVENIQYFFNEQFPIDNSIPTVNFDLTGRSVLPYAPSRPSAFKFPGGAAFDFILSNNDQPDKFGAKGETNLEEIAHQMHMMEMWHKASKMYKDIATMDLDTEEVCPCLVNEHENGIIDELAFISKLFRNWINVPIIDGVRRVPRSLARNFAPGTYLQPKKEVYRHRRDTEEAEKTKEPIDDEGIVETIGGKEYGIIPELKDSKTWNSYWKATVIETNNTPDKIEVRRQRLYNFSMYMYCKINM